MRFMAMEKILLVSGGVVFVINWASLDRVGGAYAEFCATVTVKLP